MDRSNNKKRSAPSSTSHTSDVEPDKPAKRRKPEDKSSLKDPKGAKKSKGVSARRSIAKTKGTSSSTKSNAAVISNQSIGTQGEGDESLPSPDLNAIWPVSKPTSAPKKLPPELSQHGAANNFRPAAQYDGIPNKKLAGPSEHSAAKAATDSSSVLPTNGEQLTRPFRLSNSSAEASNGFIPSATSEPHRDSSASSIAPPAFASKHKQDRQTGRLPQTLSDPKPSTKPQARLPASLPDFKPTKKPVARLPAALTDGKPTKKPQTRLPAALSNVKPKTKPQQAPLPALGDEQTQASKLPAQLPSNNHFLKSPSPTPSRDDEPELSGCDEKPLSQLTPTELLTRSRELSPVFDKRTKQTYRRVRLPGYWSSFKQAPVSLQEASKSSLKRKSSRDEVENAASVAPPRKRVRFQEPERSCSPDPYITQAEKFAAEHAAAATANHDADGEPEDWYCNASSPAIGLPPTPASSNEGYYPSTPSLHTAEYSTQLESAELTSLTTGEVHIRTPQQIVNVFLSIGPRELVQYFSSDAHQRYRSDSYFLHNYRKVSNVWDASFGDEVKDEMAKVRWDLFSGDQWKHLIYLALIISHDQDVAAPSWFKPEEVIRERWFRKAFDPLRKMADLADAFYFPGPDTTVLSISDEDRLGEIKRLEAEVKRELQDRESMLLDGEDEDDDSSDDTDDDETNEGVWVRFGTDEKGTKM